MKRIYLLVIFHLLSISILFATSYNTIVIDGVNNGWEANETFTNCSAADNAYFTWDNDFIYLGISDAEADYDNIATFIYFDTDPTGSNGSSSAYAWDHYIGTPFNADYAIVFKNSVNSPFDYIQLMRYNNTNSLWETSKDTLNSIFILDGSDTVIKFNVGTDYREVKINRSYIGNPNAIKTCMFTEQQWDSKWRYFVWPSNGWVDAGSTSGQAIPNYYGFILEDNIVPYAAPYFNANIVSWTGTSSSSWATDGNWTNNVPDQNTLVLLPATSTVNIDATGAICYDMEITSGGILNITPDNDLTVNGNLYNYTGTSGLIVQSSSSGNGSLIVEGAISGNATVQNYVTGAQWHSWAAPVSNLTANDLYLNASPEVWLTEYDEAGKSYSYISELTEPLGDMKGWMLWVGASSPKTYSFEGPLRSGELGSDNNLVRSQAADYGYNYVGNPFPSAIDWYSGSGWTKTNINNAIYIFDNGGWSSYVGGVGTGNGSRYIAMNQ